MTYPFLSACSSNTPCAPRRDKRSHTSSTPHIMTGTWKGSLRSRAVLTSFSSRRRFSMKLQILPHRGNILPHVKPVTSQSEQALPDLSHSTSRPATASRRTGFEARRSKPSAGRASHWDTATSWYLDCAVHGFRIARPLHWSGEGGTASDGLFADAPVGNPKSSAYLLAAYAEWFAAGTVFLCVVDPGVGGIRPALILEADRRWYVGPGNGL